MSDTRFSRALFAGHEGSAFTITDADGAGPQAVVLDRIEDGLSGPGLEQYALFFEGDVDGVLPQKTYHLEHETLGGMDVFLVPVGNSGRTVQYQACFNHLTTGG